jgi:hypothetical protein
MFEAFWTFLYGVLELSSLIVHNTSCWLFRAVLFVRYQPIPDSVGSTNLEGLFSIGDRDRTVRRIQKRMGLTEMEKRLIQKAKFFHFCRPTLSQGMVHGTPQSTKRCNPYLSVEQVPFCEGTWG